MPPILPRAGGPLRWLVPLTILFGVVAFVLWVQPSGKPPVDLLKPEKLQAAEILAPIGSSGPAVATPPPADKPGRPPKLENFDHRASTTGPSAGQHAAAEALQQRVRGTSVQFDPITGAPSHIMAVGEFLTGARDEPGDPDAPVRDFLAANGALFGHGPEALAQARRIREDVTAHNGMRTVVWQQELDGVPLYDAILRANLTKNGQLAAMGSHFIPEPASAAALPAPNRSALIEQPPVDAASAISLAAADLGDRVLPGDARAQTQPEGRERRQRFSAPGLSDVQAGLTWLPLDRTRLRLGWDITVMSLSRGEMYRTVVDASTGEILVRTSRTSDISEASYRVYASGTMQPLDSPTPLSPGYSGLSSTQPATASRILVTTRAFDETASPNGWIDDGGTSTFGNNVDAHLDINNSNPGYGAGTHAVSSARNFDFTLDLTKAPSQYRSATLTQLFYTCNWFHDRLYQLGFTEAAGNFQQDNFGLGGAGNDAVIADAQDGSGWDNSNFSTPTDGGAGRLQMFLFQGPNPDRDGDLDAEVVIHEMTHGVSNRLVGGGIGITALQSRGLGEGWSDFFALSLLSNAADNINGNYAMGAYVSYLLTGTALTTNYYYGIRRYPYSTDLTKNPLTLKDIDASRASPHTGVPLSPQFSSSNTLAAEVHCQGEVWCSALWDGRANLINRYGGFVGNAAMLQIVTDALKLTPANPTFLQARDAVIQADLVNNGGANRAELWSAFAKRGFGSGATVPNSSTTSGVIEAFDFPDELTVTPGSGLTATGPVGGPFLPGGQSYTLKNTSSTIAVGWTATTSGPWMSLSQSSGTLAPGASAIVTMSFNSEAVGLAAGSYVGAVTFTDTVTGLARSCAVTLGVGRTDYFTEFFESTANDTQGQAWLFTPNGSSSFYSVLRSNVTAFPTNPAGGSNLVLLDDDWALVAPSGGATFKFYGVTYNSVFVGSNGYLTFGKSDTGFKPALEKHFAIPRIAALFTDLNPDGAGNVSWRQLSDRVAVTFSSVPEYGQAIPKSFQFELFFDGRIRITCLEIGNTFGIIGLSQGNGVPNDFAESDFSSYPASYIQLSMPALTTEGAGVLSKKGVVTLTPAAAADTTISLQSSLISKLAVPASFVIPAGQSTGSFDLTVVDNAVLDGTQSVTVTATSSVYGPTVATIDVQDNETAKLSLNLPASTVEGVGTLQGTVSVTPAPAGNITVLLSSSVPGAVTVPPGVMIAAGQTSATFAINVVDDQSIDGPQASLITAHVANWTDATATITVDDNEVTALSLSLPGEISEGNSATGVVSLSGTRNLPLTITLSSGNPQRLWLPASVTVPAGSISAPFTITAVENALADGSTGVAVTASAAGFTGAIGPLTVRDNDVHHYVVAPIASPQMRGGSTTITVTAIDATDLPLTTFAGSVSVAALAGNAPVSVSPVRLTITNGTGSGVFSISDYATGAVITVADAAGRTGSSNPFDVAAGAVHHFAWASVPSPRTQNIAFPVTVTAQDAAGNTVSSFNGSAALGATAGALVPTVQVLSFTRFADLSDEYPRTKQALSSYFTSYTETSTTDLGADQIAADLAGKHVFLIPEQENAPTATLDSIGQSWAAVIHDFVGNGGVLIVCSHQQGEHLIATRAGLLDATKLEDVSGASLTKPADTPLNANTTTPFPASWLSLYSTTDATVSLADPNGRAVVLHKDVGRGHVVIIGTDYYVTGTQMDRVLANAVALAQTSTSPITMQPGNTGTFVNGVWAGEVIVPDVGTSVRLHAEAANVSGVSNAFDVAAPGALPAPVLQPVPAITGGASNTLTWSAVAGANVYEAQASTDNFATFTSSGWLASTSTTFTGLTDSAQYTYRVRARNTTVAPIAESPWSPLAVSTQDATAPLVSVSSPVSLSTSSPTLTLQGKATDASGVQALTVNGIAATTSDAFAHWTVTVSGLRAGANSIEMSASDGATPPNRTNSIVQITGVAPADANQNGLPDEWEALHGVADGPHGSLRQSGIENFTAYALGLNPNAISYELLPRVGTTVDPGDGLTYLTFTYRRRLDNVALTYGVEVSTDLSGWSPGGSALAEVPAPSLNADGLTETVTVRVSPAMQPGQQRYLRLRVTSSP